MNAARTVEADALYRAAVQLLEAHMDMLLKRGPEEAPFFASASFVIDRRKPTTEEGSN